MNKQIVIFVNLTELYNILDEIKDFLSFNIKNYKNDDDFVSELNKDISLSQITIITNSLQGLKTKIKNIDIRKVLVFDSFPLQLSKILDKINVQLIKQRYDFQSKISIKNYNLNLNSRVISKNKKDLKLTEDFYYNCYNRSTIISRTIFNSFLINF